MDANQIAWGWLILGLSGGLALFLYGMELMSDGMKKTAGDKMRSILATLTKNRIVALFCGAFVTMVIQSSSATTVMLIGFIQAGLMSFSQSLGIILGADIGTTITAQMIAFKLTDYAMLMVVFGFAMRIGVKSAYLKNIGETVMGFGLLFFGMKLMSDAMKPLRVYPELIETLRNLENPFLGILAGAVFTALIQSSSAFTGILIVLAHQNLISLEAGIPMVLGANIGTCATAVLACVGADREAKRAALAHVLFKVSGVLLLAFWIPGFSGLIKSASLSFGAGPARQIANAHTVFNVGIGLVFLPFTPLFARLILKIMPEKETEKQLKPVTWHIDKSKINVPALAINLSRLEIGRMAKLLARMMEAAIIPFSSDKLPKDKYFPDLSLVEGIKMREAKLDFLERDINEYLGVVSRQKLSDGQIDEIFALISTVKDMESIGDIIHNNVLPLMKDKEELKADFSVEGKEELSEYHRLVCDLLFDLERAMMKMEGDKSLQIMRRTEEKAEICLKIENHFRKLHLVRFCEAKKETMETRVLHMELMGFFRQIAAYSMNIASRG